MSSIAHILGQNDQLGSTEAKNKPNDTSQINQIPKITTTSPTTSLKNKDTSSATEETSPNHSQNKENSSSTSAEASTLNQTAVRKSVDLTAEQGTTAGTGANSNNNQESQDSNNNQNFHQRKRSKVSRACDECRRKKIRCDATFSSTSNSVMKPCTSCIKNKDTCSFDRVPLKRGPTKGYTKPENDSRERSRSSHSRRSSSMGNHPALQQSTQQVRPSSSSPITLPPLISLTNNVPLKSYGNNNSSGNSTAPTSSSSGGTKSTLESSNSISQPTSPRRGSTFSQGSGSQPLNSQSLAVVQQQTQPQQQQQQAGPNGSIPQGLFWKVPYSQGPFDRRGSVDSISSSFSDSRSSKFSASLPIGMNPNSSNSNFIFGARPSVNYESSVISDSEDERGSNYSPRASIDASRINRSRSNSSNMPQPTSPAMSISSLNSLNQGFNKNMVIQHNNIALAQQQQHQMVEIYYQLIHPTFPILPLNKQSLRNLLAIPPSDNQEIQEINNLIVHSFYSSLDGLIIAASRGTRSPSIISMQQLNSNQTNANPFAIIELNFSNLIKVFPQLQSKFNLYSQNIVILFISSIVLLSYSITLLGFESDIYISSSVAVFNKLKIFRLFWDKSHLVTTDNYDDYNSILKRLYVSLDILDTLQSLSFGIPKLISVDYDPSIIDNLYPNFNELASAHGLDFEMAKRNMKFGLILTKISSSRKFEEISYSSDFLNELKNKYNYFSNVIEKSTTTHHDQTSAYFLDLIIAKFELVGFLDEVCQSVIGQPKLDEELIYDFQLKCLRIVKRHLELQSNLLKSIKNNNNSIDNNQSISPFSPLAFRQSIKSLNIQKILINSLQFNKDLIGRLSKPLNDLISLNNYLSLLKPFKTEELNNHISFVFVSEHMKFLELYESSNSSNANKEVEVLKHWVGLVKDVKDFIRKEDYDGWF